VRSEVTYEGQAAIELESLSDPSERDAYPLPVTEELVLDPRPTIRALVEDNAPIANRAARFHNAVASATAIACERTGATTVVLSGGVFQNRRLLETTTTLLRDAGLRVLTPELLPPNDGGISYGQAAVATARGS
jgi:hydrogenase maturation protein HypF